MQAYGFLRDFQCLGDACEDTCCKGWGMQVDAPHKALYEKEAPELLSALDTGEAACIMRRDPVTDHCVKFEKGLCAIHRDYGTRFLSDACHFFPRITRAFGSEKLMAADLSCPEVVRLVMNGDSPFTLAEAATDRLPHALKDYLPEGASAEGAVKVITALVAMAGDTSLTPERVMLRLLSIGNSLMRTRPATWPDGISMLTRMEGFLPSAEPGPYDGYYLMQTLAGLLYAAKKSARPRLEEALQVMQDALGMSIDPATLDILLNAGEEDKPRRMYQRWKQHAASGCDTILRRWIQAQLAAGSFPYAGLGNDVRERALILCVRFATVRLGLMAHMDATGNPPDSATTVRIIQSLSRFMDHLADPALSLALYRDAGWTTDARLRGLIELP